MTNAFHEPCGIREQTGGSVNLSVRRNICSASFFLLCADVIVRQRVIQLRRCCAERRIIDRGVIVGNQVARTADRRHLIAVFCKHANIAALCGEVCKDLVNVLTHHGVVAFDFFNQSGILLALFAAFGAEHIKQRVVIICCADAGPVTGDREIGGKRKCAGDTLNHLFIDGLFHSDADALQNMRALQKIDHFKDPVVIFQVIIDPEIRKIAVDGIAVRLELSADRFAHGGVAVYHAGVEADALDATLVAVF